LQATTSIVNLIAIMAGCAIQRRQNKTLTALEKGALALAEPVLRHRGPAMSLVQESRNPLETQAPEIRPVLPCRIYVQNR
jgi:hypothetical protein